MRGRGARDRERFNAVFEKRFRCASNAGPNVSSHLRRAGLVRIGDGECADEWAAGESARVKGPDPPRSREPDVHSGRLTH